MNTGKEISDNILILLDNIFQKEDGRTDVLEQEKIKLETILAKTRDKWKILDINISIKDMIKSLSQIENMTYKNLKLILV